MASDRTYRLATNILAGIDSQPVFSRFDPASREPGAAANRPLSVMLGVGGWSSTEIDYVTDDDVLLNIRSGPDQAVQPTNLMTFERATNPVDTISTTESETGAE